MQAAPGGPGHQAPPRPPPFIPSLTSPCGPVSTQHRRFSLLGVRGNAFRLEQLPETTAPHWLFARGWGGGTEATADWLAAPASAEPGWEAECRRVGLREDRALPVRAVSGGPGAGGCWHPAAAGVPRAPQRGPFLAAVPSFLSGSSPTRRALGHPHCPLLTARLTPIHPSNPASGRILFVAFISVWPPA